MYLVTYGSENIVDIAHYHSYTEKSIRLYFSENNPEFTNIFFGQRISDVNLMLSNMINETDMRSTLALMAWMEATFRIDYNARSNNKYSDPISIEMRKIWSKQKERARLNDILNIWGNTDPETKKIIEQLKSIFKFRHWLAHGRYWNLENEYNFQTVYAITTSILHNLPFCE